MILVKMLSNHVKETGQISGHSHQTYFMKIEKIRTPVILAIAIITMVFFAFDTKRIAFKKKPAAAKGFAVIELFTSEGCSSCPSADALVSKVSHENNENVYVLSFHVDYWDRLGWKDAFSQAAFSERQKQYARHLSLDGVYTPQIVVNGIDQFVGSNETHLRSSINNTQSGSDLTIEASKTNNASIHLSYKIADKAGLLNIALIQPEATISVKRGENGGRKLSHVNIVCELKTIEATANTGNVDIEIPAELREIPFKVIAYTQQKNTFKITGAAQVLLAEKHT